MLRLAERLAVMAKANYRIIVIIMGIAENYLPKVVQKMKPKQLHWQFCVQCLDRRAVLCAVVYAYPRAEQYAELRAVSFAKKITPMQKPMQRLARSPVRIKPLTMPMMAQWDYNCIKMMQLRLFEKMAQM